MFRIVIEGDVRGEGKTTLAIMLMKMLRADGYSPTYEGENESTTKMITRQVDSYVYRTNQDKEIVIVDNFK